MDAKDSLIQIRVQLQAREEMIIYTAEVAWKQWNAKVQTWEGEWENMTACDTEGPDKEL